MQILTNGRCLVQVVACVDGASDTDWWQVVLVQVVAGVDGASGGRC